MRLVTFGETMLRLEPHAHGRLAQRLPGHLTASFAGAEANVAVAWARLGGEAAHVTVVPDNPLASALERELRGLGVDTRSIVRSAHGRLGTFFTERGANQRPSVVVYDRADSTIALADPADYDWGGILAGADWLHVTGITPAVSSRAAEATRAAVEKAAELGVPVSCDLNFRSKLWRWDGSNAPRELARSVMPAIIARATLVIGNEQDASDVLGIEPSESDVEAGRLSPEGYAAVASAVTERYPRVRNVAFSLRESVSASYNRWGAMLFAAGDDGAGSATPGSDSGPPLHFAPMRAGRYAPYEITDIVDRVGAGDAFAASLIWALNEGSYRTEADALEFAVAFSCLAHSVEGDFAFVSREEADALVRSGGSGRVVR